MKSLTRRLLLMMLLIAAFSTSTQSKENCLLMGKPLGEIALPAIESTDTADASEVADDLLSNSPLLMLVKL